MSEAKSTVNRSLVQQLKFLLKAKNLSKTIVSPVPYVGEMINQLEGHETDCRIDQLEQDLKALEDLRALEKSVTSIGPTIHDWPMAVSEYLRRTIDLAVAHGDGLILPVAHACQVAPDMILVCREALELVQKVAQYKNGKVIAIIGLYLYDFATDGINAASGLAVCRLTHRDEKCFDYYNEIRKEHGWEPIQPQPNLNQVRYTVSPFMGQEFGFLHTGEAPEPMRGEYDFSSRQFDAAIISHFRNPKTGALKTFVSTVISERILSVGSPVFSRDAVLLGMISDVENYKNDTGRRIVVRSLLGHPEFMPKKVDQH
jgi:hypothetical protein